MLARSALCDLGLLYYYYSRIQTRLTHLNEQKDLQHAWTDEARFPRKSSCQRLNMSSDDGVFTPRLKAIVARWPRSLGRMGVGDLSSKMPPMLLMHACDQLQCPVRHAGKVFNIILPNRAGLQHWCVCSAHFFSLAACVVLHVACVSVALLNCCECFCKICWRPSSSVRIMMLNKLEYDGHLTYIVFYGRRVHPYASQLCK